MRTSTRAPSLGLAFAFVFVFVFVFGCSSNGSGGGSAAIPLTSYCDSVARAFCDRVVPCCRSAGAAADDTTCMNRQLARCQADVAGEQSKGRVYDATSAGACLGDTSVFFDGCGARDLAAWAQASATDACLHVWTGTAKPGDACTEDADCTAPRDASVSCVDRGGVKTCEIATRAHVGEACGASDGGSAVGCTPDAWCEIDASGNGTCTAPPNVGEPCAFRAPTQCADGLVCDGTSCRSPAKQGESCASVQCAHGLYCAYGPDARCSPPIAEGGACEVYDRCADGLQCIAGKCSALLADGAECNWSGACLSRQCDLAPPDYAKGTCAPSSGPVEPQWPAGFDPSLCTDALPASK